MSSGPPVLRNGQTREGGAFQQACRWHSPGTNDVGAQDGLNFLVMEHLEGETLAPRLEKGPLPLVDRVVQNNTDVWLVDAVRTIRVTFDPAVDHMPIWSPDGEQIVFDSTRRGGGAHDLYQKPSSGSGSEEPLPVRGAAGDWSPDGRFLINTVLDDAAAPITLLQNWQPEAKK